MPGPAQCLLHARPILVELECSAEAVMQSAITIFRTRSFQRSALLSLIVGSSRYCPEAFFC